MERYILQLNISQQQDFDRWIIFEGIIWHHNAWNACNGWRMISKAPLRRSFERLGGEEARDQAWSLERKIPRQD